MNLGYSKADLEVMVKGPEYMGLKELLKADCLALHSRVQSLEAKVKVAEECLEDANGRFKSIASSGLTLDLETAQAKARFASQEVCKSIAAMREGGD